MAAQALEVAAVRKVAPKATAAKGMAKAAEVEVVKEVARAMAKGISQLPLVW
jgi:hypothetical protein